jgi:hypothetical protein
MISFHNDSEIKNKYVTRMSEHIKADELIRGKGWDNVRGSVFAFILSAIKNEGLRAELNTGKVFNQTGKELRCISARGYIVGTVHCNGARKQIKAHQVVWAFAGNSIPNGFILDHVNRIKTDNRLENLRLVTHLGNSSNRRSYKKEQNPSAKLTLPLVRKIRAIYPAQSYNSLAKKFNVSKTLIAKIIKGEIWD